MTTRDDSAASPGNEPATSPVALVTGGGQRVGARVVEVLVENGYRVAIHANTSLDAARERAAKIRAAGGGAEAFQADVRDEQAVARMVSEIAEQFGRIDVLVNCAAIWEPTTLEETTADDVRRHFEVNALGSFLCAQHVGLRMVEQETGGTIVNIGDWAIERPYREYAAYFPSKGAIPTMTRSLAVELGTRNPRIRVNAVLPGPVMLPKEMPETERQQVIDQTLVRREGSPDHVAHAVIFLLENDFVTGVCLPVDGGRSVHAPEPVQQ